MTGELATLRRLFSTHNPLYAISAALMFYGLRVSFRTDDAGHAAALLASLSAYVALLAGTAVFLRRVGALWEDVRMLALLVLLLLLALSVTFDRTLLADPRVGTICFLVGWLLATFVCEALFFGLRVRLRVGYRLPFHALLGLFFVYPLIVANHASQVDDRTLTWVIFLFPTAASLLLLTTIPAARRGPQYVADNGTPWGWPLFPGTLFFVLALGVIGRAYYLCYSFHAAPDGQSIFGWYFLTPLLVSIGLILLFAGRSTTVRIASLFLPPIAVYLATLRPDYDPTHAEFLIRFTKWFGAGPASVALVIGVGFYLIATLRRVPCSTACLFIFLYMTAASDTAVGIWSWQTTHWPFTAATVVAAIYAVWRREACWAWATVASAAATAFAAAIDVRDAPLMFAVLHATALPAFALSFLFDEPQRRRLRMVAAVIVVIVFTDALTGKGLGTFQHFEQAARYYPAGAMLAVLAAAVILRDRMLFYFLAGLATEWFAIVGWREYARWRKLYPGLDAIVLGLLSFAAAVLVSLSKTERFAMLRLGRRSPMEIRSDVLSDDR